MTDWDGTGLPPGARARLERAASDRVRTGFLSVPGQLGLDNAGLDSVGEVMGCVVQHLGWQGYGGCGLYSYGASPYMNTYSFSVTFDAFRPYVEALRAGWYGAIERMLAECRALGGDGVVGVRLSETPLGNFNREFLAIGTAVRHRGSRHLTRPFSTTLSGTEILKLVSAGYVPAAIAVGLALGIRHDDYQTRMGTSAFAPNNEIPGYTELVHEVRAEARRDLSRFLHGIGAEGAILSEPMHLSIHELEAGENHRDHAGEVRLVASAITRFADEALVRPRTVLSLT